MAELENISEVSDNTPDSEIATGIAPAAGVRAPEDTATAANPWESIAGQQQDTIEKLTAHIESLNAQIARLVQGGAQISDAKPAAGNPQFMNEMPANTLPDDYVPLRELGREIGKK